MVWRLETSSFLCHIACARLWYSVWTDSGHSVHALQLMWGSLTLTHKEGLLTQSVMSFTVRENATRFVLLLYPKEVCATLKQDHTLQNI